MTNVFYSYFTYFLHPFQVNYYFRKNREDLKALATPFLVDEEISYKLEDNLLELDFTQLLSISWIFLIIHCVYSIILFNIGAFLLKTVDPTGIAFEYFGNPKILIFFTLVQAIFFPIGFYIYAKIWAKIVSFFSMVFKPELEDIDAISDQIVNISLTSHFFLLIPVLGTLIFNIAFIIYLFAGLKYNLGLRTFPAILVILSPLFFLGFIFLMIIFLMATLFVGF